MHSWSVTVAFDALDILNDGWMENFNISIVIMTLGVLVPTT
jgi:hypothetical protein